MREDEMHRIAELIADAIHARRPDEAICADVTSLAAAFQRFHFTFETEAACYDFLGGEEGISTQ